MHMEAGGSLAENETEAGTLLLDPAAVQAALTPRALSILLPPTISISFQAVIPNAGQPSESSPIFC